jgi:thiol-disulfide isomerase/thioredoxin
MIIIAVILAAAGAVCSVFASRAVAVLLFGGAAFFLLAPAMNPGGTSGGPRGFSVAAYPSAAPAAHFKGANGKRLSLEDFRGRVVLLNIWATWCGPCRAEMPSLDRLQALHGADGLDVIAVSVDREGAAVVRAYYQKSGIRNLRLYVDSDRATLSAFRPDGIPMSVLIDREGNVVGEMTGAARWDSAEATALVQRYLAE